MKTISRLMIAAIALVMVAGCSKYVEWNKPRARRDVSPPLDHSYCWRQAEIRAAQQYEREEAGADQGRYSAYGRSALSGDLRRLDAQRLREELYENCLTLRARIREAEEAAAQKAADAPAVAGEPGPAGAAEEEAIAETAVVGDGSIGDNEDLTKPPPLKQ